MKTSHRCPKCGHGEVLHVPDPKDSDFDRMALGGRRGTWVDGEVGKLEVYVCLRCGYAELYVADRDLDALQTLSGARVLTAHEPEGPFR